MSESGGRKVLLGMVGIVLVAAVTALLRASWDFWGPVVMFRSAGEWRVRWPALLLIAGLIALLGLVGRKVDWSPRYVMALIVAGVVLGLVPGAVLANRSASDAFSPAEHAYMMHLVRVGQPYIHFDSIRGGLMSTTIAVVEPETAGRAARRLRNSIHAGCNDPFLYHIITVGGPDTSLVEQVLRRAIRGLPRYRRQNIQLIIMTPAPVSDDAINALTDKGYRVNPVEDRPADPRHGSAPRG